MVLIPKRLKYIFHTYVFDRYFYCNAVVRFSLRKQFVFFFKTITLHFILSRILHGNASHSQTSLSC